MNGIQKRFYQIVFLILIASFDSSAQIESNVALVDSSRKYLQKYMQCINMQDTCCRHYSKGKIRRDARAIQMLNFIQDSPLRIDSIIRKSGFCFRREKGVLDTSYYIHTRGYFFIVAKRDGGDQYIYYSIYSKRPFVCVSEIIEERRGKPGTYNYFDFTYLKKYHLKNIRFNIDYFWDDQVFSICHLDIPPPPGLIKMH